MSREHKRTALVLTGGGARAAYQVGVLKAVREVLPDPARNPFPILCATSAGAINAATLAVRAGDFGSAVETLESLWAGLHVGAVYRANPMAMAAAGARWLTRRSARALFDNAPLRQLLGDVVDLSQLEAAVSSRALLALAVTCSGYASGQSVSFFQGRADLDPWDHGQQLGAHVMLGIDHLMAAGAIPFLFPAVRMNREYFGDGALRQFSPLAPAIHLGADRILVVGNGEGAVEQDYREHGQAYPGAAQIAGQVLSGLYLDPLAAELDRARRGDDFLQLVPQAARSNGGALHGPIDVLAILPSRRLDQLAAEHMASLPLPVRALLHGMGATSPQGSNLASYLLFEQSFARALIDLGYLDTLARREEIGRFLDFA